MFEAEDFSNIGDFNSVRISLASPEQIKGWSYGEVTKPETINYRTLKPEKDGLFCEKIFGPTKDFECYCGKYKKIRYKGVICDKCGVEVARSKVRRERMGHIELASPVTHIWFAKGTPSTMGLLLNTSPHSLEQVIYFSRYVIIQVDQEALPGALKQLEEGLSQGLAQKEKEGKKEIEELEGQAQRGELGEEEAIQKINAVNRRLEEERATLTQEFKAKKEEMEDLQPLKTLSDTRNREVREKYGDMVKTGIGAEAVLEILKNLDLEVLKNSLLDEMHSNSGQRRKKASKRLRVVESFLRSGNKPDWMVLTVLPVLPPELRPMVQLDGGRFATSDLNDLYRRVINRNNRLRRLMELEAPEVIIRNEKRMLQEAVDTLIDNGRRGRAVTTAGNHKLKSLSDMLRGKQGRFRQNLLGKRVDYSGRSVIVVGPHLKLHQCGLPRRMALELFKPFIMHQLITKGLAPNIKSARRLVERGKPEVWDILEEVVKERPVLLNRAPTLHRLSIQAFEPVLIDGSAIQIHPLVCTAFNADFDGDQMAVHIPLSRAAVKEARGMLLSVNNMLLPSSGEPVVAPTLDIVFGCYYLTLVRKGEQGEGKRYNSMEEAKQAYNLGMVNLRAEIEVTLENGQRLKTSVGRILFNDTLPTQLRYYNGVVDKAKLKEFVAKACKVLGNDTTATFLDSVKQLGFHFAMISGTSIGMHDIEVPAAKPKLLAEAEEKVAIIENQYRRGLITEDERYRSIVDKWGETTEKFDKVISESLDPFGGLHMMATSGAKGNITQIRQMAGMRGLMTDPSGKIIDFPIKASFKEGLSVLEYFISTHGARKGLADTALRTSDSGYLTRRLVDVAQEVIVCEEDCGTLEGVWLAPPPQSGVLPSFTERLVGRFAAQKVADPRTGQVIANRNQEIEEDMAKKIVEAGISRVYVRSPLSCQARRGVCQLCYGRDLARGHMVQKGTAVGIIAAQSIGEPGTQLTMRTFHTGGIAGGRDITSGLPRVEELFEVRTPKGQAIISDIDGVVEIKAGEGGEVLVITNTNIYKDEYALPEGWEARVTEGQLVEPGTPLARKGPSQPEEAVEEKQGQLQEREQSLMARVGGKVSLEGQQIYVSYEEQDRMDYPLSPSDRPLVETGNRVKAGSQLTDGHIDPQDILRVMGREVVQRYLVDEVQKVYRSQGVVINDKHIETIVRQILGRVRVDTLGDTDLLPGELVNRFEYEDINAKVLAEGGEAATAHAVLLGITRASLNTESWLAAASFQETTRVLTEAAASGRVDRLRGLKENVIIGRLIPARCYPYEKQLAPALEAGEVLGLEALASPEIPVQGP